MSKTAVADEIEEVVVPAVGTTGFGTPDRFHRPKGPDSLDSACNMLVYDGQRIPRLLIEARGYVECRTCFGGAE